MAPRPRRTSIKEIAQALNVSTATVSLALNGKGRVSKDTRDRVAEQARQMGFIPDQNAISLRSGTSRLFGIVVTDLTNPFFAELNAGFEEAIYDEGYRAVVANSYDDVHRQSELIGSMLSLGVAGLLVIPAAGSSGADFELPRRLGLPYVICVREIADDDAPFVGPDDLLAAQQVTGHLVTRGHKQFAFVGGHESTLSYRHRLEGVEDALREGGLAGPKIVLPGSPTRRFGHDVVSLLLARRDEFSAIVCYNDMVATGIYSGLVEQGLLPGKDFAIVGFDNVPESSGLMPPLTTVEMNAREVGMQAGIQMLAGATQSHMRQLIAPQLLVRRSS